MSIHSCLARFLSLGRQLLVNTQLPSKVSLTGTTVACQYAAAKQGFSHWDDSCLSIRSCQARFLSLGRLLLVNTQLPSKVSLTGTTVACQYAAAKQGFSHWDDSCLSIRSCPARFLSLGRLLLVNTQLPSKVSLTGTTVACQYAAAKQVSLTGTTVAFQYAAAKQGFSHWDDSCFSIRSCQARFISLGRLLLVNTQLSSKVYLTGTTVACQYAAVKQGFSHWDDCCLSIRSCQARFLSLRRLFRVNTQIPSNVSLTETAVPCQYANAKLGFSHWDDCCLSIHSCQAMFLSLRRLFRVNAQRPSKVSLTETAVPCQYANAKQCFSH